MSSTRCGRSRGSLLVYGWAALVAALSLQACGARPPLAEDNVVGVSSQSSALTAAALPRTGWVASASSSGSGATPDKAIDGNGGTRWTTGTPQASGQWFQVDMLTPQTFVQLTLDATGSNSDYPRKYSVFVSNDGMTWGNAVATATGTAALTTVVFAQQTARFLRVTQSGTATNWWSIYELNVYPTALPLNRSGWVASASLTCQSDVPAHALDGAASTRWSSGVNQASGQWFQVDMKTPQVFDGLSIDATTSTGDYPRGFQVSVSNDGTSWGTPVATGAGTSALVTISFPTQSARFFRITLTKGISTNWWSIGELNVYRTRAPGTVRAIAECVLPQPDGSYQAVFGYNSSAPAGDNIAIPVGAGNTFETGAASRGQPTTFLPGRHTAQFIVPFDGKPLTWALDGASSTATSGLPVCTAACAQHLTDPTKPRIDSVLSTAATPLSVADSIAQRDAFRWSDVLPVPESFSDGSPRFYYGLVYIDGPGTALAMDALRIHYDNVPFFDGEFQSLQSMGLQQMSYANDGQGQFVYAFIPGAVYNALQQAAMDPTSPTEILRAAPLRPIPAADVGLTTSSSCGLQPVAACVAKASDGSLRAVFSYNNPASAAVTVPVGPDNVLTGGSGTVVVPEAFAAGTHTAVFAVPFASGATVSWQLAGTTASLSASSPLCSAATVSKIGADTFNPFPPAPPPSCRPATPVEAQFPLSRLPPAARVNTCAAVSYSFAQTLGFLWRGVDDDANDALGQAADAALALADSTPETVAPAMAAPATSGSVQLVQSPLFGKLFRKIIQKVASVGKTVVDDTRRVLRAGAGLFVGSSDVTIATTPINTDPAIAEPTMKAAWGQGFGKPISLAGMQVRASRSIFLSVGNLDANNNAGVKVLHHLGAHICYVLATPGAKVVDGWMLPITVCPNDPTMTISGSPPAMQAVNAKDVDLTALAEMSDVNNYMSKVEGYNVEQAEALVGTIPSLLGLANGNRAFTPCFAFSWQNDVVQMMSAIGMVAAEHVDDYVISKIESGAQFVTKKVTVAAGQIEGSTARLATLATHYAGTSLQGAANDALAAATTAAQLTRAASNQAQVLAQDAGDVVGAAGTAARYITNNDPRVTAAEHLVETTITDVQSKVQAAQNATQAAANATAAAATATANFLAAAGDDALVPVIKGIDQDVHAVAGATLAAVTLVGKTAVDIQKASFKTGGQLAGALIGASIAGQVFEFLAAGDILFPSAHGDYTNVSSRGVATHEYGHYTLCSLLDRVAPLAFASMYDEAAAQGVVTTQDPSATSAVLNESFADLIASQVVGATNYAVPGTDDVSLGLMNYCLAAGTGCIEDNRTNFNPPGTSGPTFPQEVLRNVSLYTDALDGTPFALSDVHMNGNQWDAFVDPTTHKITGVTLSATVGGSSTDDGVSLVSPTFVPWIRHLVERDPTLLREDNVFGGLSDVMVDQQVNWCERCEVFRLHTLDAAGGNPICPEQWVGPRPSFSNAGVATPLSCQFDGPCPMGQTLNPATRSCDPPCPVDDRFDPVQLKCVPNNIIP
jgi:hypothetical protein